MSKIDLNLASNVWGPLSGEVRSRLIAAIERPGLETWEDAYSIILNYGASWMTLWQAVLVIDPGYLRIGPFTRTPSSETLIQAINYATH